MDGRSLRNTVGLFALVACAAAVGAAAAVAEVSPGEGEAVRPAFDVLEDPAGAWSLDEVRASPLAGAFRRVPGGALNVGYRGSVYWVRFAVHNRGRGGSLVVSLPTTIDAAELFLGDDPVAAGHAGKLVAFSEREIRHRSTSFRLKVAPGDTAQVHLRLRSDDVVNLAPVVRSEPAFWSAASADALWFGAYYGLLLAMVVYDLIVFIVLRDSVHLYYVMFQVAFGAMVASFDQLLLEHLWPAHPAWSPRSEAFLGGLTMSAALMFTRAFLQAGQTAPRTGRLVKASAIAALGFAVTGLIAQHRWVGLAGRLLATWQCVVVAWAIVRARRAGVRDAGILTVAWFTLLGSVLIAMISGLGLAPRFYVGPHALKIGSAAEAMLLALGLANRIRRMTQDRERAQAELLEHRAAQIRLLERAVEERTARLTDALRSLEAAHDRMITQARLAALGSLISGIAHEIDNPLNFNIGGAAELARRLDLIEGAVQRLRPVIGVEATGRSELATVEQAARAARNAARLIDTGNARIKLLIDALRSQLGGHPRAPRPTDLIAELESVLALIQARIKDQRITIVKHLRPLPLLPCRPGELGQVFMNLLLNSCAALPDGGEIRIECEPRPGAVELRFTDSGPGIPEEHRQAIFDPFFTTRPPGEGAGLGLAISYDIVRRHAGELTLAEREPGRGATFVVRLPLGV